MSTQSATPSDSKDGVSSIASKDAAFDYLEKHQAAWHSAEQHTGFMDKLRKRIDFRLMPFLCLVYALNFLDKVLLNVCHLPCNH